MRCLLLLLLSGTALADDATTIVGPDEIVVTSEVLGNGNDETARRMETTLRADASTLRACRADADAAIALRFLQVEVKFGNDGAVRKTKVTTSTGAPAIDACVVARISRVRLDPPPMFPDRVQVNVTWSEATLTTP